MPQNHPVVAALPISAPANQTLLRNLLVQRMAITVDDAAQAADLIAVDPTTGVVILVIICLGRNYLYDPADTTTAHDGTTVLVTSDGKRYKISSNCDILVYSVLDRINTPPLDSPGALLGDAYLITTGATGAWAGHDDDVTIYTARGWEFIELDVGRMVYVEDEDAYYRKKADGVVSIGFGANALAANSVLPSQLQGGGSHIVWSVENQTTNTPPAVVDSVQYIIGSSPTGAWSGHAGKIAHGESGVWVIYAPANGWLAYDKSLNEFYRYTGSAWISSGGKMQMNRTVFTGSGTFSKNSRCVLVDVVVVGGVGGINIGGAGNATAGGTSSFGAHCSATGSGPCNSDGGASSGGTGSGGDVNVTGTAARVVTDTDAGTVKTYGLPGINSCAYGIFPGVSGESGSSGGATGGPGISIERILAASLAANETVTVGAAGSSGTGGAAINVAGLAGKIIVDEWVLT